MDGQGVHLSWLWADERFPWVLSFDPAKKRHQLWAIVPGAPEGAGHTQAVAAPMEAGPSRATGAVAFRTPKARPGFASCTMQTCRTTICIFPRAGMHRSSSVLPRCWAVSLREADMSTKPS